MTEFTHGCDRCGDKIDGDRLKLAVTIGTAPRPCRSTWPPAAPRRIFVRRAATPWRLGWRIGSVFRTLPTSDRMHAGDAIEPESRNAERFLGAVLPSAV